MSTRRLLLAAIPTAILAAGCADEVGTAASTQSCTWPVTHLDEMPYTHLAVKYSIRKVCLDREPPGAPDDVICTVIEARPAGDACACDPAFARLPVIDEAAAAAVLADARVQDGGLSCLCQIPMLTGDDASACRYDPAEPPMLDGRPVEGFCYVGEDGSPEVTKWCASPSPMLRFTGNSGPSNGSDGDRMAFTFCGSPTCRERLR